MDSAYEEYLKSPEWIALRDRVWEAQGYICGRCSARKTEATHHKTYARVFRERMEDLVGLCFACHDFLHEHRSLDPLLIWAMSENTNGTPIKGPLSSEANDWQHKVIMVMRSRFKMDTFHDNAKTLESDGRIAFFHRDIYDNTGYFVATPAKCPILFIKSCRLLCPKSDLQIVEKL